MRVGSEVPKRLMYVSSSNDKNFKQREEEEEEEEEKKEEEEKQRFVSFSPPTPHTWHGVTNSITPHDVRPYV